MKKCLIGFSGFVGGNLATQSVFDFLYNSKNIQEIYGKSFDVVYCAGMPGTKWIANKNPEADKQSLQLLTDALRSITAKQFVLISTVDVYSSITGVDEDSPIDPGLLHAYGRHRYFLEEFVRSYFPGSHIFRLAGLFGKGLKKNVIYDLMHDHNLEQINLESVFQFYDLSRLYSDIQMAIKNDITLINLVPEPISVREIATEVFKKKIQQDVITPSVRYDVRTKYGSVFGSDNEYLYSNKRTIQELKAFIEKGADKEEI